MYAAKGCVLLRPLEHPEPFEEGNSLRCVFYLLIWQCLPHLYRGALPLGRNLEQQVPADL